MLFSAHDYKLLLEQAGVSFILFRKMESEKTDRKPKNYYNDYSRRRGNGRPYSRRGPSNESNNSRFKQTPEFDQGGNRGFIITAVDEVKSYLEMRNVLEQYFHELYDSRQESDNQDKKELSTEDELESELKHLRFTRPFKQIKTHCRNAIFLNIVDDFSHVDPIKLLDSFFDELEQKRTIKTSNTCRVLPVLDTFRNNVASAKQSVIKILDSRFPGEESKKYFIEFQSRGNYKLESEDKQRMVEGVAEAVHEARPSWEVSRDNADYIIALTALRNICCLSILKDYFKRSKYNVIEFCKKFSPEEDKPIEQELSGSNKEAEEDSGK